MRKPSIFSKDYEKIMRKRKRVFKSIISFSILTFVVLLFIVSKFNLFNFESYTVSWGYKDDNSDNEISENVNEIEVLDTEEDTNDEIKENVANILVNNYEVTLEYTLLGNEKLIHSLNTNENEIYYNIKNNKKEVIIIDKNQNIFLCNAYGDVRDLTLKEYIVSTEEVYEKDNILSIYDGYIWHSQAVFIDDNRIAYVSNLPYFGYGLNQYVNVVDVESGIHNTLWGLKGNNIILKENDDGRLEANIDGNIKYIE